MQEVAPLGLSSVSMVIRNKSLRILLKMAQNRLFLPSKRKYFDMIEIVWLNR